MNETLYLEATGAAATALTPGAVLRSLAVGAGVFAEEVTSLRPLGARRVAVTLTGARARALSTPRVLITHDATRAPALTDGARAATWILRRPEDPPEDGVLPVLMTWPLGGEEPTPGAVAGALRDALGPDVGAEELGVGFVGPGFAQLSLPARLAVLGLPAELALRDGRPVRLTAVALAVEREADPATGAGAAGAGGLA